MMEAFNIVQDRIARSRLAGDPPDVIIQPRLPAFGLFDFHRAEALIECGIAATKRETRGHQARDRRAPQRAPGARAYGVRRARRADPCQGLTGQLCVM